MKAKKGTVRYGLYRIFADYPDIDEDVENRPIFEEYNDMDYPILTTKIICKQTGFNPNTVRGLIRKGVEWNFIQKVRRGHYVLTEDGFTYFYFMTLGAI